VVDPNYTMLAKAEKRWLPPLTAYEGVHARLRELAAGTGLPAA
jgi:amidase